MGSVVGCTREICFEENIKEMNLDVKKNLENLNTKNTITNKNEHTKPANNEYDKCNINYEEESEEEEEEEEEEKDSKKEANQHKKDQSKKISMQRTFKHHRQSTPLNPNTLFNKSGTKFIHTNQNNNSNNKHLFDRYNTIGVSKNLERHYKKNIHTISPKKNKNGDGNNEQKDNENDDEEIISVERVYMPMMSKKSTKFVNNFKAIDAMKSSLVQKLENKKGKQNFNFMGIQNPKQTYLRILSDFGERRKSFFKNNNINNTIDEENNNIRSSNLFYLLANKEKKDTKIKKNKDNIKGNFMLKNEKVVRYQGGFIKKIKKKNGFGIVTYSDQSTLHGTYISSTINGIARFYNNKYKSTFIGEYSDNMPKGYGVYTIKNLSLQGYWKSSILNGIAIEVWDDGTYYQGEYENNKRNGIGLYRWPDGTIYQGEFCNGQMTGKGIIFNSDDSVFSGEMLNGYLNGYGIFSWGSGALYMGYYLQDIKNGFGIYIWDSKIFTCYIGFWEMGKQQGIGAKINGNKIKYCIWNKGRIATTLKGLYEIDRYLTGFQKGYYHFFTPGYIAKLRASSFYNINAK